jgi:hypothetical protein
LFGEPEDVMEFTADKDSEFFLGSAVAHPHELVLGHYSVHTSSEALRAGKERIMRIGAGHKSVASVASSRFRSLPSSSRKSLVEN